MGKGSGLTSGGVVLAWQNKDSSARITINPATTTVAFATVHIFTFIPFCACPWLHWSWYGYLAQIFTVGPNLSILIDLLPLTRLYIATNYIGGCTCLPCFTTECVSRSLEDFNVSAISHFSCLLWGNGGNPAQPSSLNRELLYHCSILHTTT